VEGIKTETAIIALDEDTSINAAPQEEYELAQVSGAGFMAKTLPLGNVRRLAIMHDDGVNAFGFNGNK
jgi:hypothetical protein